MEVTSTTECTFIGTISYGEISNNTSYQVVGTIDKYGWVQFIETKFEKSGNIKSLTDHEKLIKLIDIQGERDIGELLNSIDRIFIEFFLCNSIFNYCINFF